MREERRENDLFFVCSLVEYIGRATRNRRIDVIRKIGVAELSRIFELADVYHCEPIENTADELITRFKISCGDFDNAGDCKYAVPAVFDIGKVYKRLVLHAAQSLKMDFIPALAEAYSSPVASKIDDYNSSVYFENPQYIEAFFDLGEPPECCVA